MARIYKFEIISPTSIETVYGENRFQAIVKYLAKTNMPRDFFDKNCRMINRGLVNQADLEQIKDAFDEGIKR